MLLILVSILIMAAVAGVLLWFSGNGCEGVHVVTGVLGTLLSVVAGASAVIYCFVSWSWFAAEHKTAIINREYGTKYTQAEVFYASDVIDTVRKLDRNRSEISVNIKQDRKP